MNFKRRSEKGITLVALVVTIVILLILAGISIAALDEENGLIAKVIIARKESAKAEMNEQLALALKELQLGKKGEATLDDVTQEWADITLEKYEPLLINDALTSGKKLTMLKNGIVGEYLIDDNLNIVEIEENNSGIELSYVVYDNRDKQNIKVVITIDSKNGIEYVQCPNGNKVYANGKDKLVIDYIVVEEQKYTFTIKENNNEEINQNIVINNDSIQETTLKINKTIDVSGYKVINIDKKMNLEGYSNVYYKISENGTWVNGSSFSFFDNEIIEKKIKNEAGILTVYAKVSNSKTNNEIVVSKKINLDIMEEIQSIQSDSLLKAIGDNDLKNGNYEVTVYDETYNVKVYNIGSSLIISKDTTFGTEEDVATSTKDYAKNMIILKVNGDLTIDNGATLTAYANKNGYGGPKGMMIYCTGTITNNGTIDMTARGAYAEGQNVYLWKNIDSSYEYVPAIGAEGGKSVSSSYAYKPGNPGNDGINRQTGGGASGCIWTSGDRYGLTGAGAQGTSYSGGSGGGAVDCGTTSGNIYGSAGKPNGGAGGYGSGNTTAVSGGAGNPGGSSSGGIKGSNGTGGLLIIYGLNINNVNKISSRGSTNTGYGQKGGGSGGGSVNIFYKNNYENTGIIDTRGGGGSAVNAGSGSISIGSILTGTYESTYTNY